MYCAGLVRSYLAMVEYGKVTLCDGLALLCGVVLRYSGVKSRNGEAMLSTAMYWSGMVWYSILVSGEGTVWCSCGVG